MLTLTREQWDADETNRATLAELLTKNKALINALDLLVFCGLPQGGTVKADDVNANALLNARREGFYEFYTGLVGLTRVIPESTPPLLRKPWEHKSQQFTPSQPTNPEKKK